MKLSEFNQLPVDDRISLMLTCCHCESWATAVARDAPFDSLDELKSRALAHWSNAKEVDILEAFAGHPRIGDLAALRNKYAASATAEQGQITEADESVLHRLQSRNDAYYEKFGFIFIVCATGKSAAEMLALLEARIGNSHKEELVNGAAEQAAITGLRLTKLFEESA